MIGSDIREQVEPELRQCGQDAAFVRNGCRQDAVERRNTVRRDDEQVFPDIVNVANLAAMEQTNSFCGERSLGNGFGNGGPPIPKLGRNRPWLQA